MGICLKIMIVAFTAVSIAIATEQSPLCDNLARYSCAPGTYKDATGIVKGSTEFSKFIAKYADKTRGQLEEKFKKLVDDPQNVYFRNLSMSALGLKSSPQCRSKDADDMKSCESNLIDGLATLAQKQSLTAILPFSSTSRMSSFQDASFLLQDANFKDAIEEINKQAKIELSDINLENKIKDKIFPNVKALIVKRLNQLDIPDDQKEFMVNKIKSIRFDGTNCEALNNNAYGGNPQTDQTVSTLLIPNAYYSVPQNTFKYCSGLLLQSSSEFEIVRTIGHELTHSIDPCNIANGPSDLGFKYKSSDLGKREKEYPLSNVLACLRSPDSVNAKNLIQNPPLGYGQVGYGQIIGGGGLGAFGGGVPPSGSLSSDQQKPPKPNFCNNDQITESFADWMGAEILPSYMEEHYGNLSPDQYKEGYANAMRLQCLSYPDTSDNFVEVHPPINMRINDILLANPKVRAQMGCSQKSSSVYCDANHPFDPDADNSTVAVKTIEHKAKSTGVTR